MKKLLTIAALLVAGASQAETITFIGSPCNSSRNCSPVATDQLDDAVSLYARLLKRPVLKVNGTAYTGTVFDSGGGNIAQTVVDPDGNQGVLVVNFSHSVRRINAGRAHYNLQVWAIINGYFTR